MPTLGSLFSHKGKGKKVDNHAVLRNLRDQYATSASIETKIRLTFLAVAMLDALGNPLQGQERVENRVIDEMRPHPTANRPPGYWTDDTSMMLCVASALASTDEPEENRVEQIYALRDWKNNGYLSSTGSCFDMAPQVKSAIEVFGQNDSDANYGLHLIRSTFVAGDNNGCASLPRCLPIAISFWREPDQARIYGKLSSEITHPSLLCKEASSLFAYLIALILEPIERAPFRMHEEPKKLTKLKLVDEIAKFPYENNELRSMLTVPFGIIDRPEGEEELEGWYFRHIPLLRFITSIQTSSLNTNPNFPFTIPPVSQLPTTDHAYDATIAVLYCFFSTKTFEEGALLAVNLCGEASTVGALYACLAATWYAGEEGKADKIFWTKRVREWRKALQRQDLVEGEAGKMVNLALLRLEEEREQYV